MRFSNCQNRGNAFKYLSWVAYLGMLPKASVTVAQRCASSSSLLLLLLCSR